MRTDTSNKQDEAPNASAVRDCPDSAGSESLDMMDDPEYHKWLEELAKDCKSKDAPCEGCMAGGMCDNLSGWEGAKEFLWEDDYENDEY